MTLKNIIEEMISTGKIDVVTAKVGKLMRYKDKRKRGRLLKTPMVVKVIRDRKYPFKSNSFNYILYFLLNLKDINLKVTSIDKPLLVDLIRLNCECSKSTAHQYANFLECLWYLRDVL